MAKNFKPTDGAIAAVIVTADLKPSIDLKSTGSRIVEAARGHCRPALTPDCLRPDLVGGLSLFRPQRNVVG